MPAPLGKDLRWRVIWFIEGLNFSVDDTAFFLGLSKRTIKRYLRKHSNTGDVNTEKLGRPYGAITLAPREELIIFEAVLERPDMTLSEIIQEIQAQTNFSFAVSSLNYYLKRNDVTHKKVRKTAKLKH